METLEQIKKDIHRISPTITDELLDLLYQYITVRQNDATIKVLHELSEDDKKLIKNATLNLLNKSKL